MWVKNGMAEATAIAMGHKQKDKQQYTHKIEMESNFHPRSLCL